jgi:hypothetical protein
MYMKENIMSVVPGCVLSLLYKISRMITYLYQLHTASLTDSSSFECWLLTWFWKPWLGVKFGGSKCKQYNGCRRNSQPLFMIVSNVRYAVWGCILSYWRAVFFIRHLLYLVLPPSPQSPFECLNTVTYVNGFLFWQKLFHVSPLASQKTLPIILSEENTVVALFFGNVCSGVVLDKDFSHCTLLNDMSVTAILSQWCSCAGPVLRGEYQCQ